MIPTHVIPYQKGELRIGWASWDDGTFTDRSIKFAYKDASGKISRGSPELPFDVLVDMIDLALAQDEIPRTVHPPSRHLTKASSMSKSELQEERKLLSSRLAHMQSIAAELPWANWQPIYDEVGARYDVVKSELDKRA